MPLFFHSIQSRILTYFVPLIFLIVLGLSISNYIELDKNFNRDYMDTKKQLEHNIVNEILLIDASYRMLEKVLEQKLAEQVPLFTEAYKKSNGSPEKIDLQKLKLQMKGVTVLHIIDEKGVIIHTTEKSVLNFDFNAYGLGEQISAIRLSSQIKFERVILNTVTGSLGIWAYIASPDNKYVLEWGYESNDLIEIVKDLDWLKTVEELRKDSPMVTKIRMFDVFGEEFTIGDGTKHKPTKESLAIVEETMAKGKFAVERNGVDVSYIYIDLSKIKRGLANPGKIVEITYNTQLIKSELNKALVLNLTYLVLSILITLILIYIISRILTNPIENLQRVAEKIAKSENYDQDIPILTKDEVGKLAESFGIMMKKIKHSYAVLEDKVAERTYHLNMANEELKQTNEELATTVELAQLQKKEIEAKNKSITSSINYARRIQRAILPPEEKMNSLFPENFVLNMPRDIVSGDFYFAETHLNRNFLVVADCTGHGIPGGFMSMIGSQLLYEIILVKDIISPDTILNELNKSIIRVLQQDKNDSRDGMDMSVLALDSVNQKIELASAMNPIYIIRNGQELEEIKADKMPIGGANLLYKSRTFTKKTLDFDTKQPTTIYLCSDGYQDQFGGNHSKKFMSKNLKQFLMNISLQPMKLQGVALEDNITTWKGQEEQTDDILVIGIKV